MNLLRRHLSSKTTTLRAEIERDVTHARPIRKIDITNDVRGLFACLSRRQQTGRVRSGCRSPALR